MFSEWIECICLVKFDIEIGQILEWCQPQNYLTADEEKNISSLAFPDSNSFAQNEGHMKYVFRTKRSQLKSKFSFGYALFSQRKDDDNPRGYTQKSIVILSQYPLVGFYYTLLDLLSDKFIGNIKGQLQSTYEQVMNWAKPVSARTYQLSLFDTQIVVEIPYYLQSAGANNTRNGHNIAENDQIIEQNNGVTLQNMIQLDDLRDRGQFQEANIFSALPLGMLQQLPKVWELILTNQSFMVVADSASQGSEIILGCISLISPLTYTTDYRPYFTIFDKEFQQIQQELDNSIIRSIIIGVTNPFFIKAYKKFPIIVRCDSSKEIVNNRIQVQNKEININDDKNVMKMLMPIKNQESKIINNSVIKKYYKNLTLEFIGMFEMYFAQQFNQVKKFDEKEFIEFIKGNKIPFQEMFENKQRIVKLYQNFIRSANFLCFLNERKNVYIPKGQII